MATCTCFDQNYFQGSPTEVKFHVEIQDRKSEASKRLLDLIEEAAEDQREELYPSQGIGWENWFQIVTLPPTISKLKNVKRLMIGASNLVRIPPEIGEMANLEEFDTYMSYRLRWHPFEFEITCCRNLQSSAVSKSRRWTAAGVGKIC